MAELWVTNGPVNATLLSGSTLYIGGSFTYVGPPIGSFAALDAAGAPDRTFPPVNGTISAIAPDGAGGWYVGGTFNTVGGHPRNNLAHLKADKSLDFAWAPNANSAVTALAVAPPISGVSGSTVYAGGNFTSIGGQTRHYIAALDAVTGLATAWNPNANNAVNALAVAPPISGVNGSTVYAGGNFTTINGTTTRNYIAALDASTGTATAWDPNANNAVNALVINGSTVYAGGNFTTINGTTTRNYIAALDAITGTATAWDPNANNAVTALAVAPPISGGSGSTVYAGGNFTTINGATPRNYIAALDASTGTATAWDPNANNAVNTLAVAPPISGASGSMVYAGGNFTTINGATTRNYIAALDAGSGLATTWNPNAGNSVNALAVAPPISGGSGSTISAGGNFTSIGGQTRNNIAALDISTGALTAWDPNANNTVYALMVISNRVYAGGDFTSIGGQTRNRIAELYTSLGLATFWNPDANNTVYALANLGGAIYAGGDFTSIGGQPRNRIAALDTIIGHATLWAPDANGTVYALAMGGDKIYAGGAFMGIGGQVRHGIAALWTTSTGRATGWNPDAPLGVVFSLAVSGNTVYAGGTFRNIGGQPRNRIAALDATIDINNATDWNPNANDTVRALAVAPPISGVSASTVYAAGDFTSIGGQTRNRIAALDATINTNNATAWNPNANNTVKALAVAPPISGMNGSTIYAGGDFISIARRRNSYLAALRDGPEACQSAASGGSWRASNWSNCGGAIPGDGDSISIQTGHTLTLYGSLAANDLSTSIGGALELPLGSRLTVEGGVTHNGRLSQTLAAPITATTTFLNLKNAAATTDKFFGATLTPAGDMGSTRVSIFGNQDCTNLPGDPLIHRCFNITPTTAQNATVRLYYTNAELNGQTYSALKLWHRSSSWSQVGNPYAYSATCAPGQPDCWMEAQNVAAYSPFALGSGNQPTAVDLQSFAARSTPAEGGLAWVGLLLLGLCGVGTFKLRL
jgi:hypothetical protein